MSDAENATIANQRDLDEAEKAGHPQNSSGVREPHEREENERSEGETSTNLE